MNYHLRKSAFLLAAALATGASSLSVAAEAVAPRSQPSVKQQALINGRALFSAGQNSQAEQALFAANSSPGATVAWHLESAQNLVSVAFTFRQTAQAPVATSLAQRALDQLALAEAKLTAADRSQAAQIKYWLGIIHERLIGTTASAAAHYRAAAALDPHAPGPAASLKRIEKAVEAVGEKQRKPGKG